MSRRIQDRAKPFASVEGRKLTNLGAKITLYTVSKSVYDWSVIGPRASKIKHAMLNKAMTANDTVLFIIGF